jgi:isoquinoline 1-oxidoreductase beta subunit
VRAPAPTVTRRLFLQAGTGGLALGFVLGCDRERGSGRMERPPEASVGSATGRLADEAPGLAPNAFIRIARDGTVSLVMHKVEMGQGTFTAMTMLLAEELEVDPAKVRLLQAPADNSLYADPLLGGQVTGGSTSVRGAWQPLREAGATVRAMLVAAAAQAWNVEPGECTAADGVVTHDASRRALHYGELVDAASKLEVPSGAPLKPATAFRLIGRRAPRVDSAAKVAGTAPFGIDVRVPGMLIGTAAASPVPGGRLAAIDEPAALAIPGVRKVLRLDGAVGVFGDHMHAARQGLAALNARWEPGRYAKLTTADVVRDMDAASQRGGRIARDEGDAPGRLRDAPRKLEAVYQMPFLAHATMEPMNCTVDLKADGCDLWVGTQVPALAQGAAAKIAGLPPEKVRVHNQYLGGGFGRRLEVDCVIQAVQFAKLAGQPLKLVWTREEDIQHDMYRPYYLDRIGAVLGDDGTPAAWHHRIVGSSVMARFAPDSIRDGIDSDAVEGARDLAYAIPAIRVEYVRHEPPIPTAFWRGVGATHNVWVVESFIDELAHAAKRDPVEYRRALLGNSPRMRAVLDLAADRAGWRTPLAPMPGRRVGRGVSVQFAFGSYMSQVAEVSVGRDGDVRVHRVVCAVDCGQAVNPDGVVAQVQSGIVFGLGAALWNEITLANGRVQQQNFSDYRVMRIEETPRIEVHLLPSREAPGGLGEPGTSAIAPALTNALYAATGRRVRKLPVAGQLKA